MRHLKTIISLILFVALCFFIYWKFFSYRALGDEIFAKIESGEIGYTPTLSGKMLLMSYDIKTDRIAESILLQSGKAATIDEVIDYRNQIFEIPSSIRKFSYISKWSDDTSYYLASSNISRKEYEKNWKDIYSTYDKFYSIEVDLASKKRDFKIDTSRQLILYMEGPLKETRLTYNVETPIQDYSTELVFIKEQGVDKLAAIFSKPK